MILTKQNVEKLDVGEHSGALLAKGLLLDAIDAGDALEEKVAKLEADLAACQNALDTAIPQGEHKSMRYKDNPRNKWIPWADVPNEAQSLFYGWYWVAFWDGSVEPYYWDPEGEFSTIDADCTESASLCNLTSTNKIYAVKPMRTPQHPIQEQGCRPRKS